MNALQWFQVIVSFTVQVSLVIAIAWGLERWASHATTKARIWSACYVSLLLLLAMGVLLPRLDWFNPWSALGPQQLLQVVSAEYVLGASLLAIWACGIGVMLARWVIQFYRVRAFIRTCPEYPAEIQQRLVSTIPADLQPPHNSQLRFRQCPPELGPFCYQFHQPLVFLPATLVHGSATELQHVLRHELTHLRTQHPLQLFAQKLTEVFLWFHPMVWMCGKRSSLVREFVCDDAASGDPQATASYLRTLLRLVENRAASPGGSLMFGRSPSELQARARRLALEDRPALVAGAWAPVLVCLAALLVAQLWVPTNPLASRHATYSPWPGWTAKVGHALGFHLRDFETFDADLQVDELLEAENCSSIE